MNKLDNAKGTRDFNPEEKILRGKILNLLKETCENYGFNPIETPIIEKYETLAAKFAAGEDSDALTEIFKLSDQGKRKLGLRFDLTVPFSRYIAMNKGLKMPFKKYITGEVFRDGPIKTGRYRQFTQFDPDIVGCKSMIADAEILALADSVFSKLDFKYEIELNNRKILDGVLFDAKINEKDFFSVTVSIDKIKKIGKEGVLKELKEKGFKNLKNVLDLLSIEKNNSLTLQKLKKGIKSEIGQEGIKEMEEIFDYLKSLKVKKIKFDPSLARGLAYYTGPIFEIFLTDSKITSSAAGGGRYDKLIGNYLGTNEIIPATGISFGIEVLIEAMRQKGKISQKSVTKVFVIPIKTQNESLKIVRELRESGINTDVDLLNRGISKNLQFANYYEIPYVLLIGQKEIKQNKVTLRDMKTGKEELVSIETLLKKLLLFNSK
jgi:histidyl-tRNA synthetase